MEQGTIAVRRALADAGVGWDDMQFAFGGSMAAGAADTMVSQLGLTGLLFINVANGCATGGSALFSAYNTIKSGVFDLGIAIGFDKHERGAFRVNTQGSGSATGTARRGLALTTQFFGMKINRYMHEHGISQSTLAKVSEKAFRNGAKNPMAWRRKPLSEARGARVADALVPADPVHVLLARRGRRGADPGPGGHGQAVHRPAGVPESRLSCARGGSAASRCWRRRSRSSTTPARPSTPPRRPSRWPASVRRTSTRPAAGHRGRCRGHAHGRERVLRARRAGGPDPARRHRDRREVPGQHRRWLPRQRRADRCLGAAPGLRERAPATRRRRRAPGARTTRKWPTPTSTARRGSPA